ncbi:MAG TPA: S8 family serine peptidase, partial [Chloroflexota bacterium]|nr:S8 family serine peptidase [Chloroflexota bacterium]
MRRLGGRGGPRAAVVGALLVVAAVAAPDPPVAAPVPIPSESVADADESPRAPFALGHVVVKFRTELAAEEADALLAEEALGPRRSIGRTGADVVSVPRGHERDAIARLRARAGVAFAEPDYVVHAASLVAPTDPLAASQWAMATIGMPDAWSYSVGNGVLVAVIDTGIDMTHEDLSSQWTYSPADGNPAHHVLLSAPDPSCVPVSQPVDDNGHGTHVAGTIAAASTLSGSGAVGVAGMAPGARILPLKALDCKAHGLATDVATAIEIAAQGGAQVINLSLGLPGSCISSPIQTAIEEAIGAGSFVVAEVGNDGNATTEVPAACGGAFGVAATTPDDAHASFSNTNGTVMLSAPGVDILSTYNGSNSDYASMSGTSMAAAHVSGCGALLKSVDGGLGPAQLAQLLESAAVDLGDPGRDDLFGAGRLDCGRAVASAAGAAPTPGPTSTRTPTPTTTPSPTGTSAPAPTASPTDTPIAANPASATTVATALSPSGTPAGSTATITPTVAVIPSPTATFGAVASATPSLVPSPTLTPTSNVAPATATPTNALAVSATATFGVATPTPTPAPTITTNAVPSPTPSQTPSGSGTPSAALPTPTATVGSVNCSGFATWAEAQAFFLAHGGPTQDPFGLDGDHDGIACESLPGAPGNAATATALAQTPPASPAASPSSTPSPGGTPSPSPSPTLLASGTPTATAVAAPSPAPGADRFEDNSSAMSYSSSSAWAQVLDGAASAGHYRRSSQVASSAAFTVTGGDGTLVRWGAVRGPTSGNADVSLDGAFVATVDLYAPATTFGPVAAYAIP